VKLILETEGVKRELNGPFHLCASATDLETLRSQLDLILGSWKEGGCVYGWTTIFPRPVPQQHGGTPLPWKQQ